MLFGTNLYFRISYFFTSFAPALFILVLRGTCNKKIKDGKVNWGSYFEAAIVEYKYIFILIILVIVSAVYIRIYLSRCRESENHIVDSLGVNFDIKPRNSKNRYVIQIQDGIKINSGFILFLTSVIAPTLFLNLIKGNQMMISGFIVFLFFLLSMLSNDVFPNVILPIIGVQLMVTKDGYNIFYFSKDEYILSGFKEVHSLGNTGSLARTFIIVDKEILSMEAGIK